MSNYRTMTIDSSILHAKLKEFFGFESFKADQEKVIKHLVDGGNTFVLMPTGGGKSLCYQLPALVMEGTAIVISPLIALMKNQVDAIRGFVSGNEGIGYCRESVGGVCFGQLHPEFQPLRVLSAQPAFGNRSESATRPCQ